MYHGYTGVTIRFLRDNERLMLSKENEMPLVIEAKEATHIDFLHQFLNAYSVELLNDLSTYGAILLRGFEITTDEDFEKTILTIPGFKGISEAFMAEQGRIHVDNLKFILHTNAVYKTGGTLYLGGFHSENYYTPDVPSYICFFCRKPSTLGGETGLVNMEKVYQHLDEALKNKLEKTTFFTAKWLITDVVERYQISTDKIEKICQYFGLPIIGDGKQKLITMYKPSIFEHPFTKKKSLQINLFEIERLNTEMRQCFMDDYKGKTWFWHRFVWKLPNVMLRSLEFIYVIFASLFYSPKESLQILRSKLLNYKASNKKKNSSSFHNVKVGSCFNDKEIKHLAQLIRTYYSSCLWKKGDILLVDNRKVAHAGMPGAGPRLIRAMICNPIDMTYAFSEPGYLNCRNRDTETIGYYMASGQLIE